jgi:cytochrome c556
MRKVLLIASALFLSAGLLAQDDEKEFQGWMKTTGATMGSLRKNLEAKNGEAAAADAKTLQEVFAKVHDFWMKKKIESATKFATTAQNGFKVVGQLASSGKFDEAAAEMKSTVATCAGCHNGFREKKEDGTYRIKYN